MVFIPQAQPHAQSLFLFPIVFGINSSKPGWLTEKIKKKKKEAHQAAMSKKAPVCFAKSPGHVFNHPRREIELRESVLGSD